MSPRIPRWSFAAVFAFGLFATVPRHGANTALCQDAPAPGGGAESDAVGPTVEESRARAAVATADLLCKLADGYVGRSLHGLAREQRELAVRLCPDHAVARKKLGFTGVPGNWVDPPPRPPPVERPVKRASDARSIESQMRTKYGEIAGIWKDHARHCTGAGNGTAARAAWQEVQFFDPFDGEARVSLDLGKDAPAWRVPEDSTPVTALARVLAKAEEPRKRWDLPGVDKPEVASDGLYSVQVDGSLEPFKARTFLAIMERADHFLRINGAVSGDRPVTYFTLHFITSREQYLRRLAEFEAKSGSGKSRYRDLGGFWWDSGYFMSYSPDSTDAFDMSAHFVSQQILANMTEERDPPAFLDEGLAYLVSLCVAESATTRCMEFSESGIEKDLPKSKDWDTRARELVGAGLDPPLSECLVSGLNELSVPAMVKARSFLLWILQGDPLLVEKMVKASKKGRLLRSDAERLFEAPLDAVDREWRLWARRF